MAGRKKMAASVAMGAVAELEDWDVKKRLELALKFIDSKKLGSEFFQFLEDEAARGEPKAVDSEE